ncbi:MAG: ferric reductase-like transmembrane domain-containing protein, partial [Actinomycetota bacterium]
CSGLAGMSAFALNLTLAGRFAFVDEWFGGLDRMFRIHQWNGRIAFLLILLHAALMAASRATDSFGQALSLFGPSAGWTVGFGVLALAGMTVAIWLTLYVRLNHEVFVYVQRIFGFVFLLAMLHAFKTPGAKASSQALTYYLGGLSALGIGAFLYRSLFANVLVKRHDYRVAAAIPLDEDVMEIQMTPAGKPVQFKPGQFLFVTFYSDAVEKSLHPFSLESQGSSAMITIRPGEKANQFHPFSITSVPGQRDLKVVFKAVGDYTRAMRALERDAWARIEGPYGTFSYHNIKNKKQIWVAGGIGITPFLSMARSLGETGYEIDFYYAMKSLRQGYLLAEFLQVAERTKGFRVIPFPEDERGFLTVDGIEEESGGLEGKDLMICGPPPMIDALRAQLSAKGFPKSRIHFEKFGFTPKARKRRA